MITAASRRRVLRGALPLLALLVAGCASLGPAVDREGVPSLQSALRPEDGRIVFSTSGGWLNVRATPTFAQALLLGARNDPVQGVVAVTEQALVAARWMGEPRGYVVEVRIPYRAIVAIAPVGSFIIDVETNEPRHVPLGAPEQTGRFRVGGLNRSGTWGASEPTAQLLEELRRRAPQATATPQ